MHWRIRDQGRSQSGPVIIGADAVPAGGSAGPNLSSGTTDERCDPEALLLSSHETQ